MFMFSYERFALERVEKCQRSLTIHVNSSSFCGTCDRSSLFLIKASNNLGDLGGGGHDVCRVDVEVRNLFVFADEVIPDCAVSPSFLAELKILMYAFLNSGNFCPYRMGLKSELLYCNNFTANIAFAGSTEKSSWIKFTKPKEKKGSQPIKNKPIIIAIVLDALTSRFRLELRWNFAMLRFIVTRVIPWATKIRRRGRKKHRQITVILYACGDFLFPGTESPETSVASDHVAKIITRYFVLVYERCLSGHTMAHSRSQLRAIKCKIDPTPLSISKTYHISITTPYQAERWCSSLWMSTSQPGTETRPTKKSATARLAIRQLVRVRKLAFLMKETITSVFDKIMMRAIKLRRRLQTISGPTVTDL